VIKVQHGCYFRFFFYVANFKDNRLKIFQRQMVGTLIYEAFDDLKKPFKILCMIICKSNICIETYQNSLR
jgi:hypothetical protein